MSSSPSMLKQEGPTYGEAALEDLVENAGDSDEDGLQALCEEASEYLQQEDWEELTPEGGVEDLDADGRAQLLVAVRERMEMRKASQTNMESDPEYAEGEGEDLDDDEAEEEEIAEVEESNAIGKVENLAQKIDHMSLADVPEPFVLCYSGATYGVPTESILYRGKPVEFSLSDGMKILCSKSHHVWKDVLTSHITVVQSTIRHKPEGWYPGKDGKDESDLDFETFYYVTAFVTPDPNDPESVRKAEYDKRRLHHVYTCVGVKMLARFKNLKTLSNRARTERACILNWVAPRNPQVNPQVAGWTRYDGLKIHTAFVRPAPTTRVKGSHKARGGQPASEAMPPTKKRVVDEGSTSSANDTEPAVDDDDDVGTLALQAGLKKLRKIAVGAKAHAWVEGGYVWIAEHH
jgi:hypothetical protein